MIETGDPVTVKAAISTASTAGWAAAGPGSPGSRSSTSKTRFGPIDRRTSSASDRRRVSTEQRRAAMLEGHDMSLWVGQRFRVLALLNLTVNQ